MNKNKPENWNLDKTKYAYWTKENFEYELAVISAIASGKEDQI